MKKVKAVLFDYDGVIADTMADNCKAWKHAFADFSVPITDQEYYLLEGMTPAAIAEKIGTQYALSQDAIMQIPKKKADYYRLDNSFRVYPEISDIVRAIKARGIKLALVSGADRHRIEEMTPKELLSLFGVIVAADDITHPKPDPEPYRIVLERLSVTPEEAVVIENAPLGIQSAKAAGCYCIALETTLPRDLLTAADRVISDHQQLLVQLSSL